MNDGQIDLTQVAGTATGLIHSALSAWFEWLQPAIYMLTAFGLLILGTWALLLYRHAKRREIARWIHDVFQRFQVGNEFDRAKLIFDFQYRDVAEPIHAALVAGGNPALDPSKRTDSQDLDRLLNYLEHLLYLADNGHAERSDCVTYFKHWFDLLLDPEKGALRRYLVNFGYERLARLARAPSDDYLLLYGTLRTGEPMHAELRLDKALQRLGSREIRGSLYDLDRYPGLVLGSGVVVAELFKIRDRSVLLRLDEFEQYDHARLEESLFRRTTLQLPRYHSWIADKLHGHPRIDAWIYLYNQSVDGKEKIEEPSWYEHRSKRQKPEFSVE